MLFRSQDLQRQVEQSKQTSLNQLYQSADPARAAESATSSAAQFQQPSVFAPLSNMFSGLSNQYLTNKLLSMYKLPGYSFPGQQAEQGSNFAPLPK